MIRYQISSTRLEELIKAAVPTWLARAGSRSAQILAGGLYAEASNIWNEVKPVYMEIQHNKCAYCERALEGEEYGKIEHDLEHYRPKSSVRSWPTEQMRHTRRFRYQFSTGARRPEGYYWLAYDILNYAAACKSCNSSLKRDYFPIAGSRAPDLGDRHALATELPLLIYPISDIDDDPETVLGFEGVIPIVTAGDDYRKRRARVTIDFFRLDSREHLRRERARQIVASYFALKTHDMEDVGQADRDLAGQFLASAVAPDAPHASCTRAFLNIYAQDPARASELARLATDYLMKISR